MIYLDSAAIVKLAHAEPESAALRRWLDERAETGWISSVLTEIEAFRALARYAPGAVASAGHHAWSAAPWTRSFHLSRRGGAPTTRTRPMAAVAELALAALTADHRENFGLRTDHGISPQLTGPADFWHPEGAASVVGIGEGGLAIFVERADAFGAIRMHGGAPVCLHHDRDGLLGRLALAHPDRLLDGLYRGG